MYYSRPRTERQHAVRCAYCACFRQYMAGGMPYRLYRVLSALERAAKDEDE